MSYIIKGKDMPQSCWRCPLCLTVDPDTYRCIPTGQDFESTFDAIDHIVLSCPLVEIPDPKIFAARMELAKCYYHPEDNEYQALRDRLDPEMSHIRADELMCELLETLGYGEAVKIFEEMEKWYS